MRKYPTYARLNVEGKRIWGDVFPNGVIPVQNISTQHVRVEGRKDAESVLTIDWKELSKEQQQEIFEKLSKQTGATKEAVLKDILKLGVPLRRGHVISCGTSRMEFFT